MKELQPNPVCPGAGALGRPHHVLIRCNGCRSHGAKRAENNLGSFLPGPGRVGGYRGTAEVPLISNQSVETWPLRLAPLPARPAYEAAQPIAHIAIKYFPNPALRSRGGSARAGHHLGAT